MFSKNLILTHLPPPPPLKKKGGEYLVMHLLNKMFSDDVSKLNKLSAKSVSLERYHFRKNILNQ